MQKLTLDVDDAPYFIKSRGTDFPTIHTPTHPHQPRSYLNILTIMKSTCLASILFLLSAAGNAQDINWTYRSAYGTISGHGAHSCGQDGLRVKDKYSFETIVPASQAPNSPWQTPCDSRPTATKVWNQRDSACDKTKDKKKKDACNDKLDKDKKAEQQRLDNCSKTHERECGNIADKGQREKCFQVLDAERKSNTAAKSDSAWRQQSQCCLRLYSDKSCKNRLFESCGYTNGIAQSDAQGWNVACK